MRPCYEGWKGEPVMTLRVAPYGGNMAGFVVGCKMMNAALLTGSGPLSYWWW